jgi:hypothetical protein
MRWVEQVDPEVAKAIRLETERQGRNLELIASENFVSEAVLEAVGSVLTNKYAEGYPGRRYYGGCEHVDTVEELAIQRAKELFGAEHANVQPHSGSQANMAVYFTVLQRGDTILAPNLAHGGHLTMGSPVNFSGKLYRIVPYGVRQSEPAHAEPIEECRGPVGRVVVHDQNVGAPLVAKLPHHRRQAVHLVVGGDHDEEAHAGFRQRARRGSGRRGMLCHGRTGRPSPRRTAHAARAAPQARSRRR